MSNRAPRVWSIVQRFGRYYVENQYGGFACWDNTLEAAEARRAAYLAEYPEDRAA